jgi:DNA replicative helicase MCM subunit Mcm2 (Cdc46/Mcm family)
VFRVEQDEEEGGKPAHYLPNTSGNPDEEPLLTVPFLRKFLYYCKSKFGKQTLSQEAFEEISQFYVEVRNAAAIGTIDPRTRHAPNPCRELDKQPSFSSSGC